MTPFHPDSSPTDVRQIMPLYAVQRLGGPMPDSGAEPKPDSDKADILSLRGRSAPKQQDEGADMSRTQPPAAVRCALLNQCLADSIHLQMQCQQTLWNSACYPPGGLFNMLRAVTADLGDHMDRIAGRIVQLGGLVESNILTIAERSGLNITPFGMGTKAQYLDSIVSALAVYASVLHDDIETMEKLGDPDTAAVLRRIEGGITGSLVRLEAHQNTQ